MSNDPVAEAKRHEERRARMEAGYRQEIRHLVHEADKEELLARWEEVGEKLEALQKKLDAMRDPTWIIALRVAAAVAVWGGLIAAGAWLAGLWGALAVFVAPAVLIVAYAVLAELVWRVRRRWGPPE